MLNTSQQISINTLVRTCSSPVSWVISYVGSQFENSRTYIEQQPLTDADRRVISLDLRSDESFRELCQSVVSLRLLFDVSESVRNKRSKARIHDFFALDTRLGFRDINDIMGNIVKRSVSPIAKRLEKSAERLASHLPDILKSASGTRTLPFYETYILLHWEPKAKSFKTSFGADDENHLLARAATLTTKADAAWLRRKQRAALLHLSATLDFKTIPLGGANVVVSLADGSIRDFLEILGFIYEAYAKRHGLDTATQESLDKFAISGSQIAYATQTDGIFEASQAFHAGVSARGERDFDVVLRLIDGLGYYTSILQSDPKDPSVLGRAERGIFEIRFQSHREGSDSEIAARESVIWNTIRHAELAGYIRTADPESRDILTREKPERGTLIIRLHRRFAPYFRFSFRGPYEATTIAASDLWQLCDRAMPINPRTWAQATSGKIASEVQPELPLGGNSDVH